ncbi:type II secretion system protein GspM [Candidatus Margulisiibacteriota bacterium]
MKLNFSTREKVLVILTVICVIFFFYWRSMLGPLVKSINKTKSDISSLQLQLQYSLQPPESALIKKSEIKIYPKEEQLNHILKFIDYKFRWFGIKLVSLRQSAAEKKLTFDIRFKASSYQFIGWLDALPQLKTVIIIENVSLDQDEEGLVVDMKLLSAYR